MPADSSLILRSRPWLPGRSLGTMRLKMCSIHVKDPAAAHEFYTGVLGFETLMAMPEYNLYIVKDAGSNGDGGRAGGDLGCTG